MLCLETPNITASDNRQKAASQTLDAHGVAYCGERVAALMFVRPGIHVSKATWR
jgi:hypothetical protein